MERVLVELRAWEGRRAEDMTHLELRQCLEFHGRMTSHAQKKNMVLEVRMLEEARDEAGKCRMKNAVGNARDARVWAIALTDDIMRFNVLNRLDKRDLLHFSATCRAAYVLCNIDCLWKSEPGPPWPESEVLKAFKHLAVPSLPPPCGEKVLSLMSWNAARCKNCASHFCLQLNDDEGACCRHESTFDMFNEEVWKCCGSSDFLDLGCVPSRHISKRKRPKRKVS